KIIVTAQQPEEAILFIHHYKPDVVFLDIDMPRMNGFKMIEELGDVNFEIVFTTAYNHYAVDAIRISAFDYLVKPVSVKDLQSCVDRLVENRARLTRERLHVLRQSLSEKISQDDKIAVPTHEGLKFFQINTIVRIESGEGYSSVILNNGNIAKVAMLLKNLEELLLKYRFYRVHNLHLINLSFVDSYIRGEGGEVVMQNGDAISVSKRKKDEFLKLISP
ncbi:MAG: response regulator transcription factor, partial [Chitinophagaceae bacterium]|nr:response regulator transcription factor [Chitinophagaceae bacterium]